MELNFASELKVTKRISTRSLETKIYKYMYFTHGFIKDRYVVLETPC